MGLEFSWLQAYDIRVPETNFSYFLQTIFSADNAPIGLLMGAIWKFFDFGYLSLVLQHQACLGQAIATISEYSHLLSRTISVNVVRQSNVAIIQLHLTTGQEQPGVTRWSWVWRCCRHCPPSAGLQLVPYEHALNDRLCQEQLSYALVQCRVSTKPQQLAHLEFCERSGELMERT